MIVPYATRGWTQNCFQQTNTWLLSLGIVVVDQWICHVQGLSEAPLFTREIERARLLGQRVAQAIKTGNHQHQGEAGICPVCHDRNLRILQDMATVECPVCAVRGSLQLEGGKIKVIFTDEAIKRHRWTEQNLRRHFNYHLKPSKDFFMRTRRERKEMAERYKGYLGM